MPLRPCLYETSKSHFFFFPRVALNTSSHGWFNVWINYGTETFLLLCPAADYILMSLVCGGKDFHRQLSPDLNHHRGDKKKILILRSKAVQEIGNIQTVKMRGWLTGGRGQSGDTDRGSSVKCLSNINITNCQSNRKTLNKLWLMNCNPNKSINQKDWWLKKMHCNW